MKQVRLDAEGAQQNQIMNKEQFETMVREHYEPLFRFAIHLTRAEGDAKDLTQHTFYVWATKGHQLRDGAKARGWLFTTLHNAFLKERRKQSKFSHDDWETAAEQSPAFHLPCANSGDFSDVRSALTKVDEIYRGAVSLFYLNDCSYQEIVDILNVPLGTVKSRIARGIAQLRGILLPLDSAARASRPIPDEIPSTSTSSPERTPLPVDDICPSPGRQEQWLADMFGRGYAEVDLSSSLLPGTPSRLRNHASVVAAFDGERNRQKKEQPTTPHEVLH